MTPNFALSLSFDGIRLMHRVTGGWHLVGEAALDDPDLNGALARLRRTALALEPSGLRTKVLLPNDQIKYLSLDSTMTSEDDIHGALDGATPYPIDELVIDFNRSGGRTHIAAVAKETLAEAEAFAVQHKFAPVTFAAVAEPFTFNTEVFFGMTQAAPGILGDGVEITRDDAAVTVIGRATMPDLPEVPDAMPLTTAVASDTPEAPEPEAIEIDAKDDAATAVVADTPKTDTAPTEAEAEVSEVAEDAADPEDAPEPDDIAEPVLSFGRSAPAVETAEKADPPAAVPVDADAPAETPDETSLPEIEDVVFASRIPQQTAAPEPAAPAPVPASDTLPPEPMFARRRETALSPGIADLSVAEPDAPEVPEPIVAAPAASVPPTPAPISAPRVEAPAPAPRVKTAPMAATAPQAEETGGKSMLATAASGYLARRQAKRDARETPVPAGIGPIGGKHAQQVGGKPKYLGLMLTIGLLIFLALVALWAGTLENNGIARWLGFGDDAPTEIAVTEPDIVAPDVIEEPVVAAVEPVIAPTQTPTTPVVTTVPGRVLSPGEADRIYAATGVWQRAPRLPLLPEETTLDGLQLLARSAIVAPISRPRDLAEAAQSLDAPFLAPPNPAPAGTVIPRDEDGFILASASGTVMPNGVLVYARAPRIEPPARPASIVAAATVQDDPLAPEDGTAAAVDVASAAVAAALGTATQPDTDSGDQAGVDVIAGSPSLQPQARPEDATEAALGSTAALTDDAADSSIQADPALAGFRPALRPGGLAPEEPFADPELAGLRPSLRPEGLAPADVPDADETAIEEAVASVSTTPDLDSVIATIAAAAPPSALVNPTQRAIVASPRPDTRPSNFSRVVAAAQARQESAPAQAASAPAVASNAAVAPTGSVPRSVASAATQDDAINLSRVNLIGVYGRPNDRRALIRLSNGRYVKVEVGTSLEGGRVTAIGDSALNYTVRGQTYSLQVPSG